MTKLCNLKKNHACSPFLCSRFPKMWTIGGQDLEKNLKKASITPRIVHVSPWKCVYRNICFAEVTYYHRTDLPGALNQINEYKSVGPSMLISGRVLKKLLLSNGSSPHGMASQLIGSFPYLASNRAGHQSPRGRQKHKGLSTLHLLSHMNEKGVSL